MIEASNMNIADQPDSCWSLCSRLQGKPMYKRLLLDSVLQFTIKKWKVSYMGTVFHVRGIHLAKLTLVQPNKYLVRASLHGDPR